MHNRPTEDNPKTRRTNTHQAKKPYHLAQHESSLTHQPKQPKVVRKEGFSILLELPSESLTHITSFLDPLSLIQLSKSNQYLHEHVKDDNTWHRAFLAQFLNVGPESELKRESGRGIMLRRTESTWKKEFIVRYNLRRRWERSRNTTITHTPHHSPVSSLHLLSLPPPTPSPSTLSQPLTAPEPALLTSSLQYGIISRSYPLTGKILRGFLDASGTANGAGIGNPNAEFSPNVSATSIASSGGTAKIAWGYTNGEVGVTIALKVMDVNGGGRGGGGGRMVRCAFGERHESVVEKVEWDEKRDVIVSGGADGGVKVWVVDRRDERDGLGLKCVWSSRKNGEGDLVRADPVVRVACDAEGGVVVGAFRSGEVGVWSGLPNLLDSQSDLPISLVDIKHIRIPSPFTDVSQTSHEPKYLTIDPNMTTIPGKVSILILHDASPYFYRFNVNFTIGTIERIAFGDGSSGRVTCVHSSFVTSKGRDGERSFVVGGDDGGCIGIYDWDSLPTLSIPPPTTPSLTQSRAPISSVAPLRIIQTPSPPTSLTTSSQILAIGTSLGGILIYDSLTFALLRSFGGLNVGTGRAGEGEEVSEVVLGEGRDLVVSAVGGKVVAWRAGEVGREEKGRGAGKRRRVGGGRRGDVAKWHVQAEMHADISESLSSLSFEQSEIRHAFGREREQRGVLEGLGLSEREAVEYVLMVSRDEEERRWAEGVGVGTPTQEIASPGALEEGVFEGDFDDLATPMVETPTIPATSGAGFPFDVLGGSAPISRTASRTSVISRTSSSGASSPPSSWNSTSLINGRVWPRTDPQASRSGSSTKVQVSPRFVPEAMEAGPSITPLSIGRAGTPVRVSVPAITNEDHFPSIGSESGGSTPGTGTSLSVSVGSRAGLIRPSNGGVGTRVGGGVSVGSSPESTRSANAWATPLSRSVSSSSSDPVLGSSSPATASMSPHSGSVATSPSRGRGAGMSLLSVDIARHERSGMERTPEEIEEEELRFAIEISLAEARSRGKDV
ncbi:hypothetical protein JAAARDRAFT_40252 [Jaapia argillacea MUCL 33604]|uniref:F-box domain-containing protein n=1 Tax=Jaapia argillacea MUCL 33604 TaxID=933084 RepID=A0A067PBR8_9AGAM|nr:hypothetical protein JAAARDRAFT_40252 [Jaapia argillacea MUCL 33604]